MQKQQAQSVQAEVVSIEAVTDFVNVVRLKPLEPVTFKAGQYSQIVLSEEDKRVFSVANCPASDEIVLHIGAGPEDSYPRGALNHMAENKIVTIELGLGEAFYRDESERPVILMAGGTGFSYTKSIADHLAKTKPNSTVLMYWGARDASALYAAEEMQAWADEHPHFQFIPVVQNPPEDWQGKSGFVHEAVMSDIVSLEPYDIYLAGPFKMAGIARDDFINHGAHKEHMFADAFAFI